MLRAKRGRKGVSKVGQKRQNGHENLEKQEEAEKFIFETKRSGSVELAELAVEEKH